MATNIFKRKMGIGSFSDSRARLFVQFDVTKGTSEGSFEWTPAWEDVGELMVAAVEVERRNKPGSTYLEQFARVCSDVVVKYAPAQHVKMVDGRCIEYHVDPSASTAFVTVLWREVTDSPSWVAGQNQWELAVPVSEDGLRGLIGKDVRWVIWNGKVIEIRT